MYDAHACINVHVCLTRTCDVCFCLSSEQLWEPQAPPVPELKQLQLGMQTGAAGHLQ